ncbi:hypothetical protein CNR37_00184 [Pseudomonas phage ventosus]|uniref:Uncharacterized protein n=1 Tax=Pseudomonas phage ventosus TaxID=2048980 RepID=A0A2H4P8D6_9CAUD|nr:hypothetical protein CNR37_00184 [Pseudomonas phage ventosus]
MATQRLATFAPNDVNVVITQRSSGIAHIVSGYSEDSIVNIERVAETFTMYTGADNTSTRIYNANKSATVTLSLQQTSASNDILSLLYSNDAASRNSSGLFSLQISDNSGRSRYFSDDAYVGVVPNSGFSNTMQTRDWVLHAHNLDTYIGGNAVLSPEDQDVITTLGGSIDAKWIG